MYLQQYMFAMLYPRDDGYKLNSIYIFESFLTFFCLYLMANLSLLRCIRSPCWKTGPVGSWLSKISNSLEDLVWSNNAVANSWHLLRSSWNYEKKIKSELVIPNCWQIQTLVSHLNRYVFFSKFHWEIFIYIEYDAAMKWI